MRNRWFSSGAVKLHALAIVSVAGMMYLFTWQLGRALAGNTLSWAYTIEWPMFAGYAVYMWWRLLHEQPEFADSRSARRRAERAARRQAGADERAVADEAEMAAYNAYLARRSAEGEAQARGEGERRSAER